MRIGRLCRYIHTFNQSKNMMSLNNIRLYFRSLSSARFYCSETSPKPHVRVRFAPSPTGHLHLGGLRTALYNFLFARTQGGKFILRVEDTDQTRVIPGAAQKLEDDLMWAGVEPDESPSLGGDYGPYIQSQRIHLYKEHAEALIKSGAAYYCFCTDTRLELLRKEAIRSQAIPRYDNRCRSLELKEVEDRIKRGDRYCVRFKLHDKKDTFLDMIQGEVTLDIGNVEGDPVILKGDGYPTYHLACVVDDHHMKISHVLRGVEWLVSTAKHLQIHRAFGWQPPGFGHLPLLLNPDGTKLSKRQGDIHIDHFRKSGIFPEVLLSFTTEFGGGFRRDQEIKPRVYSLSELIHQFDYTLLNQKSCHVDLQRLIRHNRQELEETFENPEKFLQLINRTKNLVIEYSDGRLSPESSQLHDENLERILKWALPRIHCVGDLIGPSMKFLWTTPQPEMYLCFVTNSHNLYADVLENLISVIEESSNSNGSIHFGKVIKPQCVSLNLQYRTFMTVLRGVLCGCKDGPPILELIDIIGPREAILRIQMAVNTLRQHSVQNQSIESHH